jgi:hypothetical protein
VLTKARQRSDLVSLAAEGADQHQLVVRFRRKLRWTFQHLWHVLSSTAAFFKGEVRPPGVSCGWVHSLLSPGTARASRASVRGFQEGQLLSIVDMRFEQCEWLVKILAEGVMCYEPQSSVRHAFIVFLLYNLLSSAAPRIHIHTLNIYQHTAYESL